MKKFVYSLIAGLLCSAGGWAQPAMTSTNIAIDIDGNGGRDFRYTIGATGPFGDFPVTWFVGSGINPAALAKFLRASPERVFFEEGEPVGSDREIYREMSSTGVDYGFGMLGYQAESYSGGTPGSWEYLPNGGNPLFESRTEVLLGTRLTVDDAVYYGWLRLSRPVADNHTLFEVSGYDWNPIPDATIGAGEPPPPPPVQALVDTEGQLSFTWDNRIGEMVLEWSERLDAEAVWQPVPDSGFPPVTLPPGEGNRFFRLRRP